MAGEFESKRRSSHAARGTELGLDEGKLNSLLEYESVDELPAIKALFRERDRDGEEIVEIVRFSPSQEGPNAGSTKSDGS